MLSSRPPSRWKDWRTSMENSQFVQQSPSRNHVLEKAPPKHTDAEDLKHYDLKLRLRNCLKLSRTMNFVYYEWFYSDIDHAIFTGENDFKVLLRNQFPGLKTQKLRRVEWAAIRRKMGKPRRVSPKFFHDEKKVLYEKRNKIRRVQQRDINLTVLHDLPDEIPMLATIGSRVSVWTKLFTSEWPGIYSGTVEGYDVHSGCYRIQVDKDRKSRSFRDYQVMSHVLPDTLWTACAFKRLQPVCRSKIDESICDLDELPPGLAKSNIPPTAAFGGFPFRLLELVVWFIKLNSCKRSLLCMLRNLNVEGEKLKAYGKPYPQDFKHRYASCVSQLARTNDSLAGTISILQRYCSKLGTNTRPKTNAGKEQKTALEDAATMVSTYNHVRRSHCTSALRVSSPSVIKIIQELTAALLQLRGHMLNAGKRTKYDFSNVTTMLDNTKKSLKGRNKGVFEDKVEIPMRRLVEGLNLPVPSSQESSSSPKF